MKKIIKNKKMAYLISLFCMFLWGSAFPTVKLTYREMGINSKNYFAMILVAGLRFFTAGLIVVLLMYLFDRNNIIEVMII